ncbi:hypothetical protein SERLA73DRAFT_180689 [Serpula lacrymans var. lacrymans S7.3]|uniref:Uncharacterized protein n=1 Tax=Serpula lacrymans var. lacrymans (strain S7.3) TaxID=936435 RepID=F8PVT3_SERL3|nr:hypothetical protein SERLA73DRAFT_180689 [Serpula lacrymans var. lacrymans S7.3]
MLHKIRNSERKKRQKAISKAWYSSAYRLHCPASRLRPLRHPLPLSHPTRPSPPPLSISRQTQPPSRNQIKQKGAEVPR